MTFIEVLLGPLIGLAEKISGEQARRRATDIRIADKALALRRTLAASAEDWPVAGPQTLEELVKWAFKVSRGFSITDPALEELVELRADASHKVRRAVGRARDEYHAVGDAVNPLVPGVINPMLKRQWEGPDAAAAEAPLRRARAHIRRCLSALDAASAVKD